MMHKQIKMRVISVATVNEKSITQKKQKLLKSV